MNNESSPNVGNERLSTWFGLSYASWLTIPRVLMESMPDRWQLEMAKLLEEYEDTFQNWPEDLPTPHVIGRNSKGKFCRMPKYLIQYRHPIESAIENLKKRP